MLAPNDRFWIVNKNLVMALAAVFFKPQVNQKTKFFDSFYELRLKIDEAPRRINDDFIIRF